MSTTQLDLVTKAQESSFEDFSTKSKLKALDRACDQSTHFHGYGRGVVKGMNLSFKNRTLKDDQKITELTFELNHVHHEKVLKVLQSLQSPSAPKGIPKGIKVEQAPFLMGAHQTHYKSPQVTFKGLGTFTLGPQKDYYLRDRVFIRVPQETPIKKIQQILAQVGLSPVLEKSSEEDIERMKIGLLFKAFDPEKALDLERSEAFFTMSVSELKAHIIHLNPEMQRFFEEYLSKMEKRELFPGFVRYAIPGLAEKAYQKGARALTTSLDLDKDLDPLVSIFKMGLLSSQQRVLAGIPKSSLSVYLESDVIYMQMIFDEHVKHQDKFKKLSAYHYSPIRLMISLRALEIPTNQATDDRLGGIVGGIAAITGLLIKASFSNDPNPGNFGGLRKSDAYRKRPSLFTFIDKIKSLLSDPKVDLYDTCYHELLTKHKILPEDIKGMRVESPELKDKIIELFRQHGIIQLDASGKERINGIPVDEFIHTDDHPTEAMIKYCIPHSAKK